MTGFQSPTTPGSSTVGAVRISMPDGMGVAASQGALMRMAARIRRHPFTRLMAMAAHPHIHRAKSDGTIQPASGLVTADAEARSDISANGSLSSRMIGDVITDATGAGACCHSRRPPAAVSAANGTRNLAEATNHRPYRSRARLRRHAKHRKATTAANIVDCQRWL